MLQSSRLRHTLSWPVLTKFKWTTDQRNTLVFFLIARRLWELFRLPRRRPCWCNTAKRHWTTFPPTILWDSSVYPGILGYVEMKLPMGSLFTSLLDQIARRKIKHWTDKQCMAMWQGLTSAQRQAYKLISGPSHDPEDVRNLSLGSIWNFIKGTGTTMTWTSVNQAQRAR